MKVLLISGEYPPMEGGVADFTAIIARELAAQGATVHVLTHVAAAGADDAAVIVHPMMRTWRWLSLYRTMRRLLREIEPDVVNIQYQAAAYAMHPAINLLPRMFPNTPFVVTFHDLKVPYLFPKAGPLRWRAILALARACRAVIVTNAEDHQRLADCRDISRLVQIPIGSNVAPAPLTGYDRRAWRWRWHIPPDALVLCYFGFLNASKGGEELIAALAEVCQRGYDAYLLMIGGAVGASDPTNRDYLALVKDAIRVQRLDERVIWTGYLDAAEVSASFSCADMCVLPYRDGVSFRRGSLMAALAHGMSIVSTSPQIPLPELVHGENIWLVPPCDPHSLADAIAHLGDAPALRGRLGAGARALARQFGWGEIAAHTMEVYHEATKAPQPRRR